MVQEDFIRQGCFFAVCFEGLLQADIQSRTDFFGTGLRDILTFNGIIQCVKRDSCHFTEGLFGFVLFYGSGFQINGTDIFGVFADAFLCQVVIELHQMGRRDLSDFQMSHGGDDPA